MKRSKIHLEQANCPVSDFQTAVSLHSHTLHSKETLDFIVSVAERSQLCRAAVAIGRRQYLRKQGVPLDFARGWWTPPLAPFNAWSLEHNAIEAKFGKRALVSLSDHDDIEAPLSLRVLDPCKNLPISVEWTVPYGPTFFHLGVHNLPAEKARAIMTELSAFTASASNSQLHDLLHSLAANPETLIVFNHPCWDEKVIGQAAHDEWATQFLRTYRPYIHALEINGLRSWPENRKVMQFAFTFDIPMISGGDRHALEPNTTLDLTNSASFPEFVAQVRSGYTDVLITKQYCEPFGLRVLQSLQEVLRTHEDHGRGWKHWTDRVFFTRENGEVQSFRKAFPNGLPTYVQLFTAVVEFSRQRAMLQTMRFAFSKRQEVAF